MKTILPVSVAIALLGGTLAAQAEMKLPELKKQPTVQAVLDEHLDALNKCDWNRLLAQYPEDAQINLPGGAHRQGARGDRRSFCRLLQGRQRRRAKGHSLRRCRQHDHRGHDCRSMGCNRRLSWLNPTRAPTPTSPRMDTCRPWSRLSMAALSRSRNRMRSGRAVRWRALIETRRFSKSLSSRAIEK